MAKCNVCLNELSSDSRPTESVITECGSPPCSQPCIHERSEQQNLQLCSACKTVVFGNGLTSFFGSENNIEDNRNNTLPCDQILVRDLIYNAIYFNFGFVGWTYVSIYIIFIMILFMIVFMI